MPGNEFGERTHNFFGQEGISQDQHQSQVVDGRWSSFSNGLVDNQRQINPSLIANLKSFSTQQSVDPERGQSSNSQHGLNFSQQPIRSEYSRSLLQEHQQPTNGYMHGNLVMQASPNETNVLGVDAEPSLHKNPMRFEMGESPVNYDFFGGQQQLNSQLPGMLQPFPRQQMTFNDMQLLKQQVMIKQMHEYQMQQQLQKQQLDARQLNSLNSNAVNGSHSSDNQSHSLISGIPLQDASSNCWQPDLMSGNTNWMHRGISPIVQGSSSGLMITPEYGQANLLAQQCEPSLYGMPVGGANAPQNAFSSVQMNKLAAQHASANMSSSLTNQPTSFLNQSNLQDSHMLPRSTYQEKLLFSHTSVPGSNNRPNFENFQQDDSRGRNISVQEKFGQMEGSALSEKSFMKVPENINALPKSTKLDPTEEKILFGSDDNLWDAFGNNADMSLTGNLMSSNSDLYDACPSLQSGSWSALMQSAVAETSSDNAGVHEWGGKQQSVWAINNRTQDLGVKASNGLSERLHSGSPQTAVQPLHDKGNKVNLGLLEKPMVQRSQLVGNIFHSSNSGIEGQNNLYSVQKNESIEDRFGILKAASNPNVATLIEQKNHFTRNLQLQRASYGYGDTGNDSVASTDVQGNIQLISRDSSQILESYVSNNAGKDMAESNEMGNSRKENSNDSFRSKFSQQSFTCGFKENIQVNPRDLSLLPGGKETQFGLVGNRASISRKFQYHPMGNIDVTDEPCQEKVAHLPPTLEQVSVGNQSYFGQSKSLGQPAMNMQIDREQVSQNDENCTNDAFKGMGSENSPSTSASADRSVDRCNQVKSASSRRTMLELLHKVDQSQEHSLETNVCGVPEAKISAEYGGQFQHSPSSASQGFSLQLAPPSQPAPSPDNVQFSRNSLQPLNSLNSATEKGGTSQSRFAPWASNQSFPQQSTYQGPFPGIPGENNITSGFPYPRGYHQNQLVHVTSRQSAANHFVSSSSELTTPQVKERDESSDIDQRGHMARSGEGYSPKMNVKRFEDNAVDPQKVAPKPSKSDGLVRDGLNQKESSDHMLQFGQTVSQSFSNKNHAASALSDVQKISPQMAPSWYSQYGSFKNGLVQPVNGTGRFTPLKIGEKSLTSGSLVDDSHSVQSTKQLNTADPGYIVHVQQMSGSAPGAETPSSESLPQGGTEKLLKIDKSKKRKTATSELLSWNKEVMQVPHRLKTLGEAEFDWARATNRFAEKVEFEILLEDAPPIRSKRRLIYTTQLLQQLYHPPPARVKSLVASSNYEFVAYTAARAALGDACSSTSTDRMEHFSPLKSSNLLSERIKTEKMSDQYISKAAEDFISRTEKLETDFAGLENGTTISDLRVEVQDLERFAVINRFARFHPSSSSMDRNASSLRLNPQRYVTIAPMPQNIPDRVQCLSL